MEIITRELLENKIMFNGIGIKKSQCDILGISYPPGKGWKDRLIGSAVSVGDLVELVKLGATKTKSVPKHIVRLKKRIAKKRRQQRKSFDFNREQSINRLEEKLNISIDG